MNRRHLIAAGAFAATLPLAARAQQSAMMEDGTMDPSKAPVLLAGTASKVMSQVALEMARAPEVKVFAELEVAEQTAVGMAFGVPADAPPQVTAEDAAAIEALKAADADAFDTMYIDGQIAGHEKLRVAAVDYAANGADPMAKGAALVAVTGIDTHLVMLKAMKAMMA